MIYVVGLVVSLSQLPAHHLGPSLVGGLMVCVNTHQQHGVDSFNCQNCSRQPRPPRPASSDQQPGHADTDNHRQPSPAVPVRENSEEPIA